MKCAGHMQLAPGNRRLHFEKTVHPFAASEMRTFFAKKRGDLFVKTSRDRALKER